MTPTQIIFKAWENTPKPIIYHTNDGNGNPIETQCNFLDPLGHKKYDGKYIGKCLICGAETQGGIPSKALLGNSYTDWAMHKAPDTTHICPGCAFTMMLNTASNRCSLFRYSFVADKQLHICNRGEMRDYLLDPPEPPFVMVCAVSQKKHLAIKSRVSYSRENYFCMFEEECVAVNRHMAKEIIDICEALRGIGFTKDEISAGVIKYDKIKNYKLNCINKINHLLRPIRETRLFALCLFVAQKMNEEDAICYLGLTPKTNQSQPGRFLSTQSTKAEMLREGHQDTTCGIKSKDSHDEQQSEQITLENF